MPVALCSSFWVRMNVAYGADVQFPIHFIASPYVLTAHLDVRQDARLSLEMVVKMVHKECCSHLHEQSATTAVQLAEIPRPLQK